MHFEISDVNRSHGGQEENSVCLAREYKALETEAE